MTRAAIIPQATITRAIKAVERSGADMVIEITRESILLIPRKKFNHQSVLNNKEVDYDGEINL